MKFIWRIKNKEMLFGPRHQDARLRNFVSTLTQTQSAIFISSWKKLWPLQKCTDRTLCRVRYSSTSCIALFNCQRDVNKKSIIENCELLVINITIFWFLYNAGHLTSMHVFVTIKTVLGVTKSCNILTKITQNAWERLSSWTEARTFPHIMNNQCAFTMEYKNKNNDQCSVTIRFVYT